MERFGVDFSRSVFLDWFHSLPGIDPAHTNHRLLDCLWAAGADVHEVIEDFPRGCGITTTLRAWADWLVKFRVVVVINDGTAECYGSCRDHVLVKTWRESFIGIYPRPDLFLLDSPIRLHELRSPSQSARFEAWLRTIPCPFVYPDQRKADLA